MPKSLEGPAIVGVEAALPVDRALLLPKAESASRPSSMLPNPGEPHSLGESLAEEDETEREDPAEEVEASASRSEEFREEDGSRCEPVVADEGGCGRG